MIPLSQSWPNEIRFESQFGARATLRSSIVAPPDSSVETLLISSVRITLPAAVTKSIFLTSVLLKSRRSLHKCRDSHESKNQKVLGLCRSRCSLTMNAVPTGPGVKSLGSESSWFSTAWWAWLGTCKSLCLLAPFSLRGCWILFSILSGGGQSRPKWPSLWQL